MRKTLRIISIASGIVSAVSAVILASIYLEDMLGYLKKVKTKVITNNLGEIGIIEDNLEEE